LLITLVLPSLQMAQFPWVVRTSTIWPYRQPQVVFGIMGALIQSFWIKWRVGQNNGGNTGSDERRCLEHCMPRADISYRQSQSAFAPVIQPTLTVAIDAYALAALKFLL
jgi:hypothetical protein